MDDTGPGTDTDTNTPTDTDTSVTDTELAILEDQLLAVLGDKNQYILPDLPIDPSTATESDYAALPQDPLNPITPEKVLLGRELFYEPGILADPFFEGEYYTISCATCHDPGAALSSGSYLGRGIGEGGVGYLGERRLKAEYMELTTEAEIDEVLHLIDIGPWNDTRLVNVGYRAIRGGWQGEFDSTLTKEQIEAYNEKPCAISEDGYGGLECYAYVSLKSHGYFAGTNTPPEMSVLSETSGLAAYKEYKAMFDAAFPEFPENDRMTRETSALAVAAFARTVITADAPFQKLLKDREHPEARMSAAALRGGILFFGKAQCSECHVGPGLTAAEYANIGAPGMRDDDVLYNFPSIDNPGEEMNLREFFSRLQPDYPPLINEGRFDVTLDPADYGRYEIVSAYMAAEPGVTRWGHGAFHTSIEDWVRHKVSGYNGADIDPNIADNLDPRLFTEADQWISDDEITDIVAFLREGLTDTHMGEKYGDDHVSLAGFCTPNNDPESCASYE